MKVLVIFTGGTIGSQLSNGWISPDGHTKRELIRHYEEKYGNSVQLVTKAPYSILSENLSSKKINILVKTVLESLDGGYDGIIVTHGTDTLQYSAAALGYALGLSSIPVCIVSANRPIEHKGSNALDNLRGAVSFIESGAGRGAFVIYRNDDSKTVYAHRATRLVGVKVFSDEVASIKNVPYGRFDKNFKFIKNRKYKEQADEVAPVSAKGIGAVNDGVLFITPHVGMRYPCLSDKVKYVIFNTYHSGTLDTKSAKAKDFFAEARERGIAVYAVGISGGATYESAEAFAALGITPLYNIAPIAAYMKLWLLTGMGEDVKALLPKSLSGDIC